MKRYLLPSMVFLVSCVPSKGDLVYSLDGRSRVIPVETEAVSFATIQTEILTKCTECHRWAKTEAGIKKYIIPGNPDGSEIFQSVRSGEMPEDAPPLTTKELELLRGYINSLVAAP
jgi:hypothetical protein